MNQTGAEAPVLLRIAAMDARCSPCERRAG
jgi:hypothetical protein